MEYRNCNDETHGLRLCSHCGCLLGSAELARRLRRKISQLAQFGLIGSRVLLKG